MEGGSFHTPRLAALLRQRFVESRLHMDYPDRIPAEKFAVHRRLQQELIGSTGVPHYAILDPDNGEFLLRWHLRGPDPAKWELDFERMFTMAPAKGH